MGDRQLLLETLFWDIGKSRLPGFSDLRHCAARRLLLQLVFDEASDRSREELIQAHVEHESHINSVLV